MLIRDRIRELRRVPANQLRPNPKNWRTHPTEQLDALKGVLAEVDGQPFAEGPWCWILKNVRALKEPVPIGGKLQLWTPPEKVLLAVTAQLK